MSEFKSGYVAIVGRPNVGKSTLLNRIVGEKISIVSRKAQTTRHRISGILTLPDAQFVFVDTPGFQTRHANALNRAMNRGVTQALADVDVVVFVVEAGRFDAQDKAVLRLLPRERPVILAVNKIDKVHPDQLLAQIDDFRSQMDFKEIVPISALQGNNVSRLIDILSENLEEGFQYFPEDQITDHPERFLVSEMIREKILKLTKQEVPHSVAVIVESMKRDPETDKVHIRATIMVERDSQKGIIIGKKGAMLKKIGKMARRDIEIMLGDKVYLETWVKVKKN